ncbi:hypothetical protein [Planctobacterium marinum]
MTWFHKRLFPLVWFGFLVFFFVMAPFSTEDTTKRIIFMVAPFPMALFGYFLMKKLIFGLVDEVYRQQDQIICRNGDKEERFNLSDIQSALYYTHSQPAKCVLRLRRNSNFGREIEFIPKINGNIFSFNADVEQLVDDVDRLNQGRN